MTQICSQTSFDSEFQVSGVQKVTNSLHLLLELREPLSHKVPIVVFPWTKIFEFKKLIVELPPFQHLPSSELRLFVKNIQLVDQQKTILDYRLTNYSLILLQTRRKLETYGNGTINPYKLFEKQEKKVLKLINCSIHALQHGSIPKLTSQGTSGAYMIENSKQKKISIFKPFDEEVYAPNNPRNMKGQLGSDAICKGILSGECATREVAAYLLDSYGNGFHSVPTTTYVQFYHPSFKIQKVISSSPIVSQQEKKLQFSGTKHGSLQEFVYSVGMASDFGSSRFSISEVHKIGILDIRILNCDRNDANILVQQTGGSQLTLIPIDHGLSLPDNLQIYEEAIAWMNFPQSKQPFTMEELQFIRNIEPMKDVQKLSQKLGFRAICLRNFRISQTFLKQAASFGFTLYQIGKMIYRAQNFDSEDQDCVIPKTERSDLQKIVMQAENLYLNVMEENQKQNLGIITQYSDTSEGDEETEVSSQNLLKDLLMKKKISLPTLKRKDTSFHQKRHEARKEREGINGVGKTVWNKYNKDEWSELFYHYFENLCKTFLEEKKRKKELGKK